MQPGVLASLVDETDDVMGQPLGLEFTILEVVVLSADNFVVIAVLVGKLLKERQACH